MIEIDHTLLSPEALSNLIIDIITRQSADSDCYKVDIVHKENQLIRKLAAGEVVIVYYAKDGFCDIINSENLRFIQNQIPVNGDPQY